MSSYLIKDEWDTRGGDVYRAADGLQSITPVHTLKVHILMKDSVGSSPTSDQAGGTFCQLQLSPSLVAQRKVKKMRSETNRGYEIR